MRKSFLVIRKDILLLFSYSRRKEIDLDDVEGTIGERGQKKSPGEPIEPMLVDDLVYKSFLEYAINDLKLKTYA